MDTGNPTQNPRTSMLSLPRRLASAMAAKVVWRSRGITCIAILVFLVVAIFVPLPSTIDGATETKYPLYFSWLHFFRELGFEFLHAGLLGSVFFLVIMTALLGLKTCIVFLAAYFVAISFSALGSGARAFLHPRNREGRDGGAVRIPPLSPTRRFLLLIAAILAVLVVVISRWRTSVVIPDNPDIRIFLDEVHAGDSLDEVREIMLLAPHFSEKRLRNPAPMKEGIFGCLEVVPGASREDRYASRISFRAEGRNWSYRVNIYFDGQDKLLAVGYSFSPHFPAEGMGGHMESFRVWNPTWKQDGREADADPESEADGGSGDRP